LTLSRRKLKTGGIIEVILALSTTMEGDTTNYYLYRRLGKYDVRITTLARGVAMEMNLSIQMKLLLDDQL